MKNCGLEDISAQIDVEQCYHFNYILTTENCVENL